jgi:hypothetical protein
VQAGDFAPALPYQTSNNKLQIPPYVDILFLKPYMEASKTHEPEIRHNVATTFPTRKMIAVIQYKGKMRVVVIQQMRLSNKIMVYSTLKQEVFFKTFTYEEISQNVVFGDSADRQYFEAKFSQND